MLEVIPINHEFLAQKLFMSMVTIMVIILISYNLFAGLFVLNVVLRDEQLRPMIINNLTDTFQTVVSYKLQEDLNEIFISSNFSFETENLKEGCHELNAFFKRHNTIDNGVDIDNFLSSMSVHKHVQ